MNNILKFNLFFSVLFFLFSLSYLYLNYTITFILNDTSIYYIIYLYFIVMTVSNLFVITENLIYKKINLTKNIFLIKSIINICLVIGLYLSIIEFKGILIGLFGIFFIVNILSYYEVRNFNKSLFNPDNTKKYITIIIIFFISYTLFLNKNLGIPYVSTDEFKLEITHNKTFLEDKLFTNLVNELSIEDRLYFEWELFLLGTKESLNIPLLFSINDMRDVIRYRFYNFKINGDISNIHMPTIRKNFISDFYIKKGLLDNTSGILNSINN